MPEGRKYSELRTPTSDDSSVGPEFESYYAFYALKIISN